MVEHRTVAPDVAGSIPVTHPIPTHRRRHLGSPHLCCIWQPRRGGFVRGEAAVSFASDGDHDERTIITVEGRAQVDGTVARVGQRLLASVSKMMMDRFFACLSKKAVDNLS